MAPGWVKIRLTCTGIGKPANRQTYANALCLVSVMLLCLAMPGQPEVNNVSRSQFKKKFTDSVKNL